MASTSLIATIVPALQSSTSGLSDNSKNIVIGVITGGGGVALLALIGVIVWRRMRKNNEAKPNMSNVPYFSDDGPAAAALDGTADTERLVCGRTQEYKYNNAANF
jgi:Mid2 like cell wall stress sensor